MVSGAVCLLLEKLRLEPRKQVQVQSHTLSLTLHWLFCSIWVMVQSFEALQTEMGLGSWTYTGTIPGNVYWALTKHSCETLTCHADPLRGQRLAALTNAVLQESPPPLSAIPWEQPACPSLSAGVDYQEETLWLLDVVAHTSAATTTRDKQPEPHLNISLRFSTH